MLANNRLLIARVVSVVNLHTVADAVEEMLMSDAKDRFSLKSTQQRRA